jgi:hypothetical protein
MLQRSFGVGVLVLVTLAACSSSSSSDASGGPAADGCADLIAASREAAVRCNLPTASPDAVAARDPHLTTRCKYNLSAPGNGITRSAVAACAKEIRGSCDGTGGACRAVNSALGTLPAGTPCGVGSQCAGGVCTQTAANGCGTCSANDPPVAPAELAEGDVCYDPAKPSGDTFCAAGLACKTVGNPVSVPIRCTKRGADGIACSLTRDCIDGLACIEKQCAPRLANGGACEVGDQCAAGACSKATGTCVPFVFAAAGAVCNNQEKRCARGTCARTPLGTDGTCVDPIADGAPCTGASSPNSPKAHCDAGAKCVNGVCQIFDPATCQ